MGKQKKTGIIIPNGVKPEAHELDTILYFTDLGKDIELIPAAHTPGVKSPDFWMDGLMWEAKSPTSKNRRSIERTFYQASRQSLNLVIDLRRINGDTKGTIVILEKCFKNTRKVRNMYVLSRDEELKRYHKK